MLSRCRCRPVSSCSKMGAALFLYAPRTGAFPSAAPCARGTPSAFTAAYVILVSVPFQLCPSTSILDRKELFLCMLSMRHTGSSLMRRMRNVMLVVFTDAIAARTCCGHRPGNASHGNTLSNACIPCLLDPGLDWERLSKAPPSSIVRRWLQLVAGSGPHSRLLASEAPRRAPCDRCLRKGRHCRAGVVDATSALPGGGTTRFASGAMTVLRV